MRGIDRGIDRQGEGGDMVYTAFSGPPLGGSFIADVSYLNVGVDHAALATPLVRMFSPKSQP